MVSILPAERSAWDVIGKSIGQNVSQTLPGAVQQGYQRQTGMNALEQAKQEIAEAGNDPIKIAMAMSRMAIASPESARAIGPIAQTAMQQAKVGNAYPGNGQGQQQQQPSQPGQMATMGAQLAGMAPEQQANQQPIDVRQSPNIQSSNSNFATPSPFNIKTVQDMDAESQRYAHAVNDPDAYNTRFAQLQAQNNAAIAQREGLEDFALKSGVSPGDLPLYMKVGSKFDPRNPTEWARKADVAWKSAKSNFDKLDKAFIPGVGSRANREQHLDDLKSNVQDLVKAGLEQETREKLANNYLTPTEIEGLIHPLTPNKIKAIDALPKGIFPSEDKTKKSSIGYGYLSEKNPFISYEEAKEKAPREMQVMQDKLADFFLKNVDKDTSILQLRDKILKGKDYDWRQIGPALRQAEKMGLKLEQFQSTEMADVETNPPYDALPYLFRDWDRIPKYIRGNK